MNKGIIHTLTLLQRHNLIALVNHQHQKLRVTEIRMQTTQNIENPTGDGLGGISQHLNHNILQIHLKIILTSLIQQIERDQDIVQLLDHLILQTNRIIPTTQ